MAKCHVSAGSCGSARRPRDAAAAPEVAQAEQFGAEQREEDAECDPDQFAVIQNVYLAAVRGMEFLYLEAEEAHKRSLADTLEARAQDSCARAKFIFDEFNGATSFLIDMDF